MVTVIVSVTALLALTACLYVVVAVISAGKTERDQVTAYFSDLLIQANIQFQSERDSWSHERAALLERIQRPEQIPPTPVLGEIVPNNEIVDDLHLVGSINDLDAPPPPDDAA